MDPHITLVTTNHLTGSDWSMSTVCLMVFSVYIKAQSWVKKYLIDLRCIIKIGCIIGGVAEI